MKVSEVIKNLESLKDSYGDLEVTITTSLKNYSCDTGIVAFDNIYFGFEENEDRDEINIRNFIY